MSGTGDNPNEAAERLERALERIAQAIASLREQVDAMEADPAVDRAPPRDDPAAKARLDAVIDRLHAGLGERS